MLPDLLIDNTNKWQSGDAACAVSLADLLSWAFIKHSADLVVLLVGMPYLLGPDDSRRRHAWGRVKKMLYRGSTIHQ